MFVLSKIYWYLAAPGNLLVLILLLGALALLTRRRIGIWLAVVGTLGFAAIVATPIAEWTIVPLENRFPQPQLPDRIDGIIVLGGAVDEGITRARGLPAVNDAAERVIEAAALARRFPEARIVLSGGEGLRDIGWNEAEPTRDILVSLGVPVERIVLEIRSRNTIENAEDSFAVVHPREGEVWLLVTSAMHMPRAVGCFRHVGWRVVPFPVDYRTAPGVMSRDYMLDDRLTILDLAVKEWVGLVAYRALGRIDTIFPGPESG
jgi:uncharacterized SAM-binding protein YcdF (DUF218 family)